MNINTNLEIAQFVILDVGIPNPAQVTQAVLSGLGNLMCISQGRHIPAVGLALINASYEPVFRLSTTQSPSKLQKILLSINSVKDTGKCRARITMEEFQDCIYLGIQTALQDFGALRNQPTEGEVRPEKLQITIFSKKNLSATLIHIEKALSFLNTGFLSKILVVELVEDFMDRGCVTESHNSSTILEYLQVAGTAKEIDQLMKRWLAFGDEQQHVKLMVQDLVIWCDARDCLIRPSEPSHSQEAVDEDEVLEVIRRLPSEGACVTQTFGDPVLLIPCRWQSHFVSEESEDLTHNAKYFLDLCNKLGTSDEYLIAKYDKRDQPVCYILLMPGADCLLSKKLVPAEMALPVSDNSKCLSTYITPEVYSNVKTALESLPPVLSYDPSDFSSGLYKFLGRKILQPSPAKMEQEPVTRDHLHESIIFDIEVKRKTKLKRKRSDGRRVNRYSGCEIPQLADSDQQTLARCLTKKVQKFMNLPSKSH